MRSLNFLCLALTYFLISGWNMALIGSPIVRIKVCDRKGREKFFQLSKDSIRMLPQDIGHYRSTLMIDSMPQPALLTFVLNNTPHFIHFGFINLLDHHLPCLRLCLRHDCMLNGLSGWLFFLMSQ